MNEDQIDLYNIFRGCHRRTRVHQEIMSPQTMSDTEAVVELSIEEATRNKDELRKLEQLSYEVSSLKSEVRTLTNIVKDFADKMDSITKKMNHMCNHLESHVKQHESNSHGTPMENSGSQYTPEQNMIPRNTSNHQTVRRQSTQSSCNHKDDQEYTPTVIVGDSSEPEKLRVGKKAHYSSNKTEKTKKLISATTHIKRKLLYPNTNNQHVMEEKSTTAYTILQTPYGVPPMYKVKTLVPPNQLPQWMNVAFKPTKEMKIVGVELAVAAYIFALDLDPEEMLVPIDNCIGNRRAFMTIVPGNQIECNVLILVASMLSKVKNEDKWYLPTTFAQCALRQGEVSTGTLNRICNDYMGKLDNLQKIYIPINVGNHWFLMIVDLLTCQLVYLDSAKSNLLRGSRIRSMRKVASFLEEILEDQTFCEHKSAVHHALSEFTIIEPKISQQAHGSNDCGVWVSQWMVMSNLWATYELKVDDYSRMRLAIDLVLKDYNPRKIEIVQLAVDYFNKQITQHKENS